MEKIHDLSEHLAWWKNFYQKEGVDINIKSLNIPLKPTGDWWIIIVAPEINYQKVLQMIRGNGIYLWRYTGNNLDKEIDWGKEQRREIKKPYAIWVKSDIDINLCDIFDYQAVTLLERLLLEIFYFNFLSRGNHIDTPSSITLCLGSRGTGGFVPYVIYSPSSNTVIIDWGLPHTEHPLYHRPISF
jgi:hypothetical protein